MMWTEDDRSQERFIKQLFAGVPAQDMRPAAAKQIEAACLEQLRRRKKAVHLPLSFIGVIEAVLASLMAVGYLLSTLGRALALYGIPFR